MSDYTQITNFTAKDALASGDPAKTAKGADVDAEFAAIATAIATKANSASPTLTGTVTITGATLAGNATISGDVTASGAWTHSGAVDFTSTVKAAGSAGTAGQVLQTTGSGVQWAAGAPNKNFLINGDFRVAQRGTSFTSATTPANNDDTYLLDRWVLLADGNDIVDVTQDSTTVPTNGLYACALDVETANKKFGILQILEQKDCVGLIGSTVTLSFKAKVSSTTNLDNVKAAIISWDGTADTVTSDIISAWNIEGTDPTLVANWTYENTPTNLNLTTSYATFSLSAAIDTASTKNVAVFIWSDVTTTSVGEFLYITDVKLEAAASATSFVPNSYEAEFLLCARYYEKLLDAISGGFANPGNVNACWIYTVPKRVTPTFTAVGCSTTQYALNRNYVAYYTTNSYGTVGAGSSVDAEL